MFNPADTLHITRLNQALTASTKQLKDFQDKRLEAYKQYVGKHYKNGTLARVPLPMIAQAVSVIMRSLVSSEPLAMIAARKADHRPSAYSFELALNRVLLDMDLGRSMQEWVFDAMMSPFGVMQVALDVEDVDQYEGMQAWTGRPYAQTVLFDDWVHDMSARRIDKVGFCGHRYSVVKEAAFESGLYDPAVVEKISKTGKTPDESTQQLSLDRQPYDDDYEERIELWDVYLPRENIVVTMSREHEGLAPLRVVEWNGPETGPYEFLWFDAVPGNTMPLPPVALWRDLHELANGLFNKLARQAMRQKRMISVDQSALKDGKLVVSGADGEAIPMDNPDKVREIAYGGIDQSNFAFVLQLKQLHSYFAGNIDVLGGLAPQSGTVGQDQLLSEAAAGRVKSMQDAVDKSTARVMRSVARFLLGSFDTVPITLRAGSAELNTFWSPEEMQGDLTDYDIDIIPHSLRRKAPEERLNTLFQYLQTVLIPLAPMMQAQGQAINTEALHKLVTRLTNMPEMADLVTYMQGQMMPSDEMAQPTGTQTRVQVRDNRTTKTPQGMEQQLIAKLMSQGNSEAA